MNLLLYIFVFVSGVVCSAIATRAFMYHLGVVPLQRSNDAYLELAHKAQTDVLLVKALRAGEIGLAELLEVGVLEESTSSPGSPTLTLGEPTALPASKPQFIPNFYKRAPKVANLAPGDEVWVNLGYVDADRRGNPVVYAGAATCTSEPKVSSSFGRLRVYEDGSLELGSYVGDVAGSDLVDQGDELYRPVARVVNLDTEETRELDQVTLCTQLDT
jgi:hypothetical protein